jgi:hypothetical protein
VLPPVPLRLPPAVVPPAADPPAVEPPSDAIGDVEDSADGSSPLHDTLRAAAQSIRTREEECTDFIRHLQ